MIDKYKDLHPDLLTLENSRFYFRTMLLHWGALLIFSSSTFAIAYASAETDKGAELSTPLSFMDEQGTTNAGILPYASIPFYQDPAGSDNPGSVLPAESFQGHDSAPVGADPFFYVNSRFDDLTIAESGFIPPDPHGAAGRNMLIAIVNSNISAKTKAGGVVFKRTLNDFFSEGLNRDLTSAVVFHPKILYDASEDRFVAVALFGRFEP